MRILDYDERSKTLRLQVTSVNDLWLLDAVITKGTLVESKTTRMTKTSDNDKRRVPTTLCIEAEKVSYQAFTTSLRVTGKVVDDPDDLGVLGSYHTISVQVGSTVSLKKDWSLTELEELKKSREDFRVLIVSLDYESVAITRLWDYGLETISSWSTGIPGKQDPHREASESDAVENVARTALQYMNDLNMMIVAGPGSLKTKVVSKLREILGSRGSQCQITTMDTSYGGIEGAKEAFQKGVEKGLIAKFRLTKEAEWVDKLLNELGGDSGRAAVGMDEVKKVIPLGAVDTLIVSTKLLKESYDTIRPLISSAEKYGARVVFVSEHHEKGEQLIGLGGIAALLRYSVSVHSFS